MMDNDGMTDEARCEASARGIVHCLRLLADEAAAMHLGRTCEALRRAMRVCAVEAFDPDPEAPVAMAGFGTNLH